MWERTPWSSPKVNVVSPGPGHILRVQYLFSSFLCNPADEPAGKQTDTGENLISLVEVINLVIIIRISSFE